MTTQATKPLTDAANGQVPPLENGDRLSRAEFERRYEAMPGLKKAELINGVVFIPSPVRIRCHGQPHADLAGWLWHYQAGTPGVTAGIDATSRLGDDNEPQPDCLLFIEPECGGQVRIGPDDILVGGPDLAAEVAASSSSIDLNQKLEVYRRHQVREYIVWRTLDREVDWFVNRAGDFARLPPGPDGILRSEVFPGLWLDPAALVAGDAARVLAILQEGMRTREHADFVARLDRTRGG